MMPMTLQQLAAVCAGRVIGDAVTCFDAVSVDTRTLVHGDGRKPLFVALPGARFDAHAHLLQAHAAGAVAALVTRAVADCAIPQVLVDDAVRALADLAREVQKRCAATVIAVTGSNGKTSVKNLLGAILSGAGKTFITPGNRNNEIGLPLAVLETPDDARFAVYEMGTGAPGDIAYLTAIAPPHVGLVNNIAPAHLQRMGTLDAIADTKAAVYDDLREGGVAVINADDAFAGFFAQRAKGHQQLFFGVQAHADVRAEAIQLHADGSQFMLTTPIGRAQVQLALAGRHNICNALAATAVALAVGLDLDSIVEGLHAAEPVEGRMRRYRLGSGAVLIDDSYNANPGSLAAAIDWLAAQPLRNWLVLGDMRELGDQAVQLHAKLGKYAADAGIERLYALGALAAEAANAFGEDALLCESHAALVAALQPGLQEGVQVLVKGSRGSAMDEVVQALLAQGGRDAA